MDQLMIGGHLNVGENSHKVQLNHGIQKKSIAHF